MTDRVLYVAPYVTEELVQEYDYDYSMGGQTVMETIVDSVATDAELTVVSPLSIDGDRDNRVLWPSRYDTGDCEVLVPLLASVPPFNAVAVFVTTFLVVLWEFLTREYDAVIYFNFLDRTAFPATVGKLFGTPVVVHYADGYLDFHNRKMAYVERLFLWAGRWTLDGAVCVNNHMADLVPTANTTVVRGRPSIGMPSELPTVDRPDDETTTVTFIGRFDRNRGIEPFLSVTERVLEQRDDIVFGVAGYGPEIGSARRAVERLDRDGAVEFLGTLDRDAYTRRLLKSDLLVNFQRPDGELNRHSFPSKLLDFLASGRPAATVDVSDAGMALSDELIVVEDGAELEAVLITAASDPDELEPYGCRAQLWVEQTCTTEAISRRVLGLW